MIHTTAFGNNEGTKYTNHREAVTVLLTIKYIVKSGINPVTIAIITPYNGQTRLVKDSLPTMYNHYCYPKLLEEPLFMQTTNILY